MENLSQEEIDALLEEAVDTTAQAEATGDETAEELAADEAGPFAGGGEARAAVRPFDFNRPNNNLSRGFERNLRGVSESFAKDASLALSNLMRSTCDFTFGGIRVSSFGETLSGFDNPSCIAMCTMEPLKGLVLLHVDAGLMFTFFTKLLGGPLEEAGQIRDFTEIELGMAQKLLNKLLDHYGVASEKIVHLHPVLLTIENNPNYLNAFSDGEAVLNLQYNVSVDDITGSLSFVLPLASFESVREQFDPKEGLELRNPADRQAERRRAQERLGQATAELSVAFRPQPIQVSELVALKPGELLVLDHPITRPLVVKVEGKALFEGVSGQVGRSRAVRVLGRKEDR